MAIRITLYFLTVALFYFYCRQDDTMGSRDVNNYIETPINELQADRTATVIRFKTVDSLSDSVQKSIIRKFPASYILPSLPSPE